MFCRVAKISSVVPMVFYMIPELILETALKLKKKWFGIRCSGRLIIGGGGANIYIFVFCIINNFI